MRITKQTAYNIDKVLDKRDRRGIREYLVRWQWYSKEFDSCIPDSSVKNIKRGYERCFFKSILRHPVQQLLKNLHHNTLSAFTIKLAKPIELNNAVKLEVGICEIMCPPS